MTVIVQGILSSYMNSHNLSKSFRLIFLREELIHLKNVGSTLNCKQRIFKSTRDNLDLLNFLIGNSLLKIVF
ncbi:hypothetical protein MYP_970 [Sporocytophaga myxococcoides]|uniref:Uncharacterized protein n=1 Tax=Sporocytophaga myxococcoides TaxID=153721 RepID=A0A098LCL3_9BACT|nr:hypothetical protein MYP_970 [Sporocytophaga myxococcoides]